MKEVSIILRSIWGHLGVTLGSFLVYGGTLEHYLREFDVDKLEMASVIGIYAGLVGPKSENVEKVLVFKAFLKGSRRAKKLRGGFKECPRSALGGPCAQIMLLAAARSTFR